MTDWVSSGRVKIERAKENIAEFDSVTNAFLARNPYRIVTNYDVDTDEFVCTFDVTEPLPLKLSAIAADAVHNLRSSLDMLWLRVMYPQRSNPPRRQYFPVFDSAEECEARFARKIKGFRQTAVDILLAAKPYKGGNDALWALDAIDCKNKHELLVLAVTSLRTIQLQFTKDLSEIEKHAIGRQIIPRGKTHPLKHGAEVLRVKTAEPKMAMQYEIIGAITFGEGEILEGETVLPTLHQFTNMVEGVVTAFAVAGLLV